MYIDHERKFIFFHAEKCAGTFIENHLCESFKVERWKTDWASIDWDNGEGEDLDGQFIKHMSPSRLLKKWGANRFDQYYKFGCIRDPWGQILSYFSMCRQWKKFASTQGHHFKRWGRIHPLNDFSNISDFILEMSETDQDIAPRKQLMKLRNYFTKYYRQRGDGNTNLLVDKIVRFEELNEDLNEVLEKIDADPIDCENRSGVDRDNGETINCQSDHNSCKEEYTEEACDTISRLCSVDIDFFDYGMSHPYLV